MIKVSKFVSIVIVFAVCLGLMLVPGLFSHSGNTVYLKIEPETIDVAKGENFTLNVTVPITAGEEVAAAEAHIDFDSAYFNVTNVTPGNGPSVVLKNVWNNSTGTVDFAAGRGLGEPAQTSNFTLCTIECQANQLEGSAAVDFIYVAPQRKTRVLNPAAVDYLTDWSTQVVNGTVRVGSPTLTVNVTPADKGNVTINAVTPSSYPNTTNRSWDEVVELNATTTVENWTFTHWSEDLSGSENPTNITMDDSKNVTANFAPLRTLTMAVNGNGTTVPVVGSHIYGEGTVVNISATPDSHWQFVNWTTANMSEIGNSTAQSTTVTVDENETVTANFAEVITATLEGHVTFPGRVSPPDSGWIEDFTVRFFQGGSETGWSPINATTNNTGVFNITGLDPGTYNVSIKNWTCLSELVTGVTLTAGNTTVVDFGTTREGDCNGDNWVTLEDRSLLYAGWDTEEVIQGGCYCDLNRDGWLTLEDRSLMYANWDQGGD